LSNGFTLWFTGLSGAGKTTLSKIVEQRLRERGLETELLDGDVVRTTISKGLGFTREDRDENVRRIGYVCHWLTEAKGVVAIAAFISPYRAVRDELRERLGRFVEVYVECPINALVDRDVKGLYKKALAGEIQNFTGVSDPYEPPLEPDIVVRTSEQTPEESAATIIARLESLGYLASTRGGSPISGSTNGRHG
jgi:adenylyl-sulfate kinase